MVANIFLDSMIEKDGNDTGQNFVLLSLLNKVCAYRTLRKKIEKENIRKKWDHSYMEKKVSSTFRVFLGHQGGYSLEQLHHLFQSYVS